MGISLKSLKDEIQKSGTNKGKFLFLKEGVKARVRFLTDLEDGVEIPFHNNYQLGVNVPCQERLGRECEYCDDDELKIKNMYAWSVYDYEAKEVKVLMTACNRCSPVPALTALYEDFGTLTDRDYEIKQIGNGTSKAFNIIPLEKKKFRNAKVKPLSESAILKIVDKAYPADNNEAFDEPKNKKKSKYMNEPEDEWEEEETTDYESMSPKELYALCKEREIDCKPKKSKEYYIDFLEQYDADNAEDEDEWEEEETTDYESMSPKELYALCKEREIDCKPKKSKEYYIDFLEQYDADNAEDEDEWEEEEAEDDTEWEDED